jgi:hypothetical protein
MKNKIFANLLTGLFILATQIIFAQKAEIIQSITKVPMSNEYYTKQAQLWKAELDKNNSNTQAWFNYYRANRYMQIAGEIDTVRGNSRFDRLKSIIDDMEKKIPNSFEFNYLKWLNSGNDLAQFKYLEKAYAIDPEREETYTDFVSVYEILSKPEKRDEFAKKWYAKGSVSPGYLNYNYNVLMSLKPNAIVLTVGDNDTYPLWILQAQFGIRKDVQVVNLSMLYIDEYFEQMSNKLQFGYMNPLKSYENAALYVNSIVKTIANNKLKRAVYTSLTLDEKFTKPVSNELYLVGLAYEYSTEKFDNIAVLKKNMEQKFALDYLQLQFYKDNAEASIKIANGNYLVPMITLYEHYKLSNELNEVEKWKQLITLVAKQSGQEEHIKEYIKE